MDKSDEEVYLATIKQLKVELARKQDSKLAWAKRRELAMRILLPPTLGGALAGSFALWTPALSTNCLLAFWAATFFFYFASETAPRVQRLLSLNR